MRRLLPDFPGSLVAGRHPPPRTGCGLTMLVLVRAVGSWRPRG